MKKLLINYKLIMPRPTYSWEWEPWRNRTDRQVLDDVERVVDDLTEKMTKMEEEINSLKKMMEDIIHMLK